MKNDFEKINQEPMRIDLYEVGLNNFRSNIHSYVVVGYKLFLH